MSTRKKERIRMPVFDSMQSCEAIAGVPKATQQQAKREGCDAFDSHSRVHLEKLLRWLFRPDAEAGEGGQNWADRLKRAQALTAELELEVTRGKYVLRSDVESDMARVANKMAAVLRTKFQTELPPKLDGAPAVEIAEKNREAMDQCFKILHETDFMPDSDKSNDS